MSEHWTVKQFQHYQKTGQKPEDMADIEERVAKRLRTNEKALQTECGQWLHHRGYRNLTADNAKEAGDPAGWYGHLFNPRKNPLMSDIFVFDSKMDKSLMVELKVKDVWQDGQKEMVDRGAWWVCFEFSQFEEVVKAWEKRYKNK